jgi:hypothetical protein
MMTNPLSNVVIRAPGGIGGISVASRAGDLEGRFRANDRVARRSVRSRACFVLFLIRPVKLKVTSFHTQEMPVF